MSAKYLIRLDDACHTMDREKWNLIEEICDEFNIKPIVAVVPDNKDPKLKYDDYDESFWDTVRNWQAKGWAIAMHGYTHVMLATDTPLLLPYYKRSEFAGLSYEEQAEKIRSSWNIFKENEIKLKIWVAPAHCFDHITLKALKNETTIRVISDGIAWDLYYEWDFFWIPQQLWELKERSSGLWSVCMHPNLETIESLLNLRKNFNEFHERIISFEDVDLKPQGKSFLGSLYHRYFWFRRRKFLYALR